MKHAPISRQRYDLYVKYRGHDSEISGLHGECGMKHAILSIPFALMTGQAFADQDVNGFQELTFGMSIEEVAELYTLTEEEAFGDIDQVFGTNADVIINGEEYDFTVAFVDNQLILINVGRWVDEGDLTQAICEHEFNEVFGLISARYGDPDQDPSVDTTQISETRRVAFTGLNGNKIIVASVNIGTSCHIFVSYMAQRESNAQF